MGFCTRHGRCIAAWQVQEVVKLLTGRGEPLRRRLLFMDSEFGAIDVLEV